MDCPSLRLCGLIEVGLANRLSLLWLLESPVAMQALAIVEGGHVHPKNGGYVPLVYTAAKALDIDVVVFDSPGHWLDGPEYAHWRADFVPVELLDNEPDDDLTSRIVTAVRSCGRRIDGIMTLCEWYKPHVARAYQELGLPTEPPRAYEIAPNKFQTSTLANNGAILCHSVDDAKKALSLPTSNGLSLLSRVGRGAPRAWCVSTVARSSSRHLSSWIPIATAPTSSLRPTAMGPKWMST